MPGSDRVASGFLPGSFRESPVMKVCMTLLATC